MSSDQDLSAKPVVVPELNHRAAVMGPERIDLEAPAKIVAGSQIGTSDKIVEPVKELEVSLSFQIPQKHYRVAVESLVVDLMLILERLVSEYSLGSTRVIFYPSKEM